MKIFICIVLLTGLCACVGSSQLLEMQSKIIKQQNQLDKLSQKTRQAERQMQQNVYENEINDDQKHGCQLLYTFYKQGYAYGLATGRNIAACSVAGTVLFEELSKASNSRAVGAALASMTTAGCKQCANYHQPVSFFEFEQSMCR